MYLEKIKLAGFKSFAGKTTLDFSEGMSAIVGPNGSGKSNIADAIRWVLGEQSMKTLRGKKTEDVIFAGTKSKGRMGVAEVTLVLNNEKRTLPLNYKKIEITRRVFRDGEGEYMINKNKVRLLDIHELLAKAGFGQRTYGVVGQGMIDSLLKASPKELREIFYDACGVREFHIKKNISESKLSRTRTNFERGDELIAEIEPRIKSLERQAGRAQKKENFLKEKAGIVDLYFAHTYQWAIQKEDALAEKLSSELKREKEITRKLDGLEKKIETSTKNNISESRLKVDTEIEAHNIKLNEAVKHILILDAKIQIEKERSDSSHVKELERQIDESRESIQRLTEMIQSLKKEKENSEKEAKEQETRLLHLKSKISEIITSIERVTDEMKKQDISIEEIDVAIRGIVIEQERFFQDFSRAKTLEASKKNFSTIFNKLKALASDIHKANGGEKFEEKLEKLMQRKEVLDDKIRERTAQIQKQSISCALIESNFKRSTEEKTQLEKKRIHLESRLRAEKKQKIDISVIKNLEKEKSIYEKDTTVIEKELLKFKKTKESLQQKEQAFRNEFVDVERAFRRANEELNEQKDYIRSLEADEAQSRMKTTVVYQEMLEENDATNIEKYIKKISNVELDQSEKNVAILGEKLKAINHGVLSIGEIDEEALREYKDTKKRYDFLTHQREDLVSAEKKLKRIVSELDEKIENKFNASFDVIGVLFEKYFKVLFNGGSAKLIQKTIQEITEAEEMYDEDAKAKKEVIIEVHVNPPGKKLSNLSMLSGGERAMASIALLMAIIESNPPPFIVLDEVDAALDEANSRRFAKILTAAVKRSQVLAITHNRATMTEASILYGVTMQESGVSKILSIRLEEARAMRSKEIQNKTIGRSARAQKVAIVG